MPGVLNKLGQRGLFGSTGPERFLLSGVEAGAEGCYEINHFLPPLRVHGPVDVRGLCQVAVQDLSLFAEEMHDLRSSLRRRSLVCSRAAEVIRTGTGWWHRTWR